MNSIRIFIFIYGFCLLFGSLQTVPAQSLPNIARLLTELDKSQDLDYDLTAKVKITQQKTDEGVKTMESIYYRRDKDDAFMMVMTAPDSEKGDGYLRVGDNMWIYLRNTRTFQKVTRDTKIGGSDASMGDMEQRKFSELYGPALDSNGREKIQEETLGSARIPTYRFEVMAKVNDVKYPKMIIWVAKEHYLTLKVDSYSLSGTLMETAYYKNYTTVEGRYIPLWIMFNDEFEKGNKTIVELSGISLKKIPDTVFTKGYLENLSK